MLLPQRLDRAAEIRSEIVKEARPRRFILTGVFFPGFLKGIEKNAEAIARHRLVLSALAAEQYHAAQNRFPDSIVELSPRYLPDLPVDPFSRKPLLYRREGLGYVLYSTGPDRQDDGA